MPNDIKQQVDEPTVVTELQPNGMWRATIRENGFCCITVMEDKELAARANLELYEEKSALLRAFEAGAPHEEISHEEHCKLSAAERFEWIRMPGSSRYFRLLPPAKEQP